MMFCFKVVQFICKHWIQGLYDWRTTLGRGDFCRISQAIIAPTFLLMLVIHALGKPDSWQYYSEIEYYCSTTTLNVAIVPKVGEGVNFSLHDYL